MIVPLDRDMVSALPSWSLMGGIGLGILGISFRAAAVLAALALFILLPMLPRKIHELHVMNGSFHLESAWRIAATRAYLLRRRIPVSGMVVVYPFMNSFHLGFEAPDSSFPYTWHHANTAYVQFIAEQLRTHGGARFRGVGLELVFPENPVSNEAD